MLFKFSAATFLFVVLLSCNSKNKTTNDLIEKNLFGHVKFVSETTYEVEEINGQITKKENGTVISSYIQFNEAGFVFEEIENNINYRFIHSFKFNEKGDKTEETLTVFNNQNTVTYKMIGYYENGKLHESNSKNPDQPTNRDIDQKSLYKYDDKGNKIEVINYKDDGTLFTKTEYKYDAENHLIEELLYEDRASNLSTKKIYEYDDKGNKVSSKDFDYGELASVLDEYGNDTIVMQYRPYSKKGNYDTFKYDEKGNEIEVISYQPDGALLQVLKYKFDNWSNVIEESCNSFLQKINRLYIAKYSLEYDSHHNWIKKTEIVDEKPVKVSNRKIEYYN